MPNLIDDLKMKTVKIADTKGNLFQKGVEVTPTGARVNEMLSLGTNRVHVLNYGAIAASVDDHFVASTDMKVGTYTIKTHTAIKPARPVLITVTRVDADDTMGTLAIVGTNINGEAITETIAPDANTTKVTLSAFSTITSITGADWEVSSASYKDQIKIGFGDPMGSPIALSATTDALIYFEDATPRAWNTVVRNDAVEKNILSFNANQPNGARKFVIMLASQTP